MTPAQRWGGLDYSQHSEEAVSHFSVIVATREYPTEDVLRKELQPYHEFECTGTDDEFVQDIDETEKVRAEFEADTATRLRDAGGKLYEPWDDCYFREPTAAEAKVAGFGSGSGPGPDGRRIVWTSKDWGDGKGYRAKVRFTPEGMEEVEVPRKEFETFAEYVAGYHGKTPVPFGEQPDTADREKHKYGYCLLDAVGEVVKVIDRTNPNKKHDYWRAGGRYCRKFVPKAGSTGRAEPLSYEWTDRFGGETPKPPEGVDIIRAGDMDKAAMKSFRVAERRQYVRETLTKCGIPSEQADQLFTQKHNAHEAWMKLDGPRPRGKGYGEWCEANGFPLAAVLAEKCFDSPDIHVGVTVEQWVADAPYLTGFAFLRERKWAENGEMGWWGAVHDEKEPKEWEQEFQSLADAVPDDWYLTVVDCHI